MAGNKTADAILKMADHAVTTCQQVGVTLDFSHESIELLEEYLAELHAHLLTPASTWTDRMKWSAAVMFGGYVGEVLRRSCGGEWEEGSFNNPKLVIGRVTIMPAAKVMKRLTNGLEDHIASYFQTILTLIAASAGESGHVDVG